MPDDAAAPVAVRAGGLYRRLDGGVDSPVLVVFRDPLDQPGRLVGVDDERVQQVQQPALVEHPTDQHLERRPVGDDVAPIDRLPRRVVLPASGERAHRRRGPVRDDDEGVGREQRRDVVAVGLHLVPGAAQGGVRVAGVLQLQQGDRQPVEEDDDVGPTVLAGLHDGELVHDEPVVARRLLPVDQPHQRGADLAGSRTVLDRHAAGEQLVHTLVLRQGVLRLRTQQPSDGLLDHARGQVGVDAKIGVAQASGQDDLVVRRALLGCAPGREHGAGQGGVAQRAEPVESGLLNDALGDPAAAHVVGARKNTSMPRARPALACRSSRVPSCAP